MTNKELAESLGTTPGTIHYHLRPLVAQGFLSALEPRPGPRGSREQPYRATGRSWELAGSDATLGALRTVAVDELQAAADDQVIALTRLGLTLTGRERDELVQRLGAALEEASARSREGRHASSQHPDPDGDQGDHRAPREPLEEVTVLLAVTTGRAVPGSAG